MRYEDDVDLIRFLRQNTNIIISTFNKSGTRNLRILKHALNDFQKVFEMVNKSYPNVSNRVMQTMLIFTIAISFEIKAGKITKDKFVDIKNNDEYKSILVSSRVLMDNKQFYIKEFDNNYYYNFKAEYRYFKFIEYYVRTRIFDMRLFKDDMEKVLNISGLVKIPTYKKLLTEEYWKISDDEFLDMIEEILTEVKKGKIQLVDMVKLYAYFSYFSRKKLIAYDINTLKDLFAKGMTLSSSNSEYCANIENELSKIAISNIAEDMEDILNKFYELNNQLKDKMYKKKADEIFKCIPMKMENFYDRFDKECMNIPIFKYQEPHQIFQKILNESNEDIVIIKEKLIKRVELYGKEIKSEKENMSELKKLIDEYTKEKDNTIKIVMLKEFSQDLDYMLAKYETVKEKNE